MREIELAETTEETDFLLKFEENRGTNPRVTKPLKMSVVARWVIGIPNCVKITEISEVVKGGGRNNNQS